MTSRLTSLDAMRGFTIAAMILVNYPGSWDFIYQPLEHAKWNGLTPTDLIFPFFLFHRGCFHRIVVYKTFGERDFKKGTV